MVCPEVRCVTCTERPLLRKVLFPDLPHPEHHEDDYFHPPHPTPGLRLKTQHANPACPNRLGDWHSNNDTAFVLPLSFYNLSICCTYTTVESGIIVQFLAQWSSQLPTPHNMHYLPHRLQFFFPLPVSRLTTEGCWNITDFIRHPPTHKPTLHLVIHLVPFTLCLIKLCWPCGFFFFPFFFFKSKITLRFFVFVRSSQGVTSDHSGVSRQTELHRERCLPKESYNLWVHVTQNYPLFFLQTHF